MGGWWESQVPDHYSFNGNDQGMLPGHYSDYLKVTEATTVSIYLGDMLSRQRKQPELVFT